jgi:hypothetical protein
VVVIGRLEFLKVSYNSQDFLGVGIPRDTRLRGERRGGDGRATV